MNGPDPLLLGTAPKREVPPVPRKAWLAALLALGCDGLGHFYCGRVGAAVGWALVPVVATPLVMTVGVYAPERLPIVVAAATAIGFGSRVLQLVLAARLARRSADYRLKPVNAVPMYFAFFLLAWAGQNAVLRPFRARVIEPFKIPTSSMAPALIAGDQVFVLKAGPHAAIQRGDVIVYERKEGPPFVKRVVALGGETVAMTDNVLSIDGVAVPQAPCAEAERSVIDMGRAIAVGCAREGPREIYVGHTGPSSVATFGPVTVPAGHYFVLGDWRDNSIDSRQEGTVPADQVVGRAAVIWVSFADDWSIRWGRIGLQPSR